MIKIGDIVRIVPFEVGRIGGINHISEMKECIGQLHVVVNIWSGRISLDANSFYWSDEVLEKVEGEYPVKFYNKRKMVFEEATYNPQKDIWETETGCVTPGMVGVTEEKTITLPYDIYNVGKAGDKVNTTYFKERYYLSSEYLPMYGAIEMG